jgi:GMP synthase (glutamine-hydrolysing)
MSKKTTSQPILIIDFGSPTTQQLARRVREQGVYSEILPYDAAWNRVVDFSPQGIILSADSTAKSLGTFFEFDPRLSELGVPLLAISHSLPAEIRLVSGERETCDLTRSDSAQGEVALIRRFVVEICGCQQLWNSAQIIEESLAAIRDQVGSDQVLLGLSGGVDSSVVAALLHRAIGDQLTCVFVDHGLLRLNEGDQVMETFAQHMGIRVIRVNAQERFYGALAGEVDPERKRKIIGHTFVEIFDEEASKLKDVKWLAQGTIYPDVVESIGAGGEKGGAIKSHHNVGGLPETMALKLLEPLRELFKDEVRRMGIELGLPAEMIYRHPFPGPGLGVRILGEIKGEYADLLRRADAVFMEELYRHDLYDKVSQAFAVFLPVRSVGVVDEQRRYDYVIALRAVETIDFMTARWAHLPYDFLDLVSQRIIHEIDAVSRVVYDISGKPPATIEWE